MRVAANGNNGNNYKGVVKVEKWPGRYNIIKFTLHADSFSLLMKSLLQPGSNFKAQKSIHSSVSSCPVGIRGDHACYDCSHCFVTTSRGSWGLDDRVDRALAATL